MNTRLGQTISILTVLGLVLLWSASILAAEQSTAEPEPAADPRTTTIERADEAAAKAAEDAADAIAKEAVRDLDVRLIGLNVLFRDGRAITVAAN
jgi:hypothetical protein